jgi:hypothetical protein
MGIREAVVIHRGEVLSARAAKEQTRERVSRFRARTEGGPRTVRILSTRRQRLRFPTLARTMQMILACPDGLCANERKERYRRVPLHGESSHRSNALPRQRFQAGLPVRPRITPRLRERPKFDHAVEAILEMALKFIFVELRTACLTPDRELRNNTQLVERPPAVPRKFIALLRSERHLVVHKQLDIPGRLLRPLNPAGCIRRAVHGVQPWRHDRAVVVVLTMEQSEGEEICMQHVGRQMKGGADVTARRESHGREATSSRQRDTACS